jgi:hypothetical protein
MNKINSLKSRIIIAITGVLIVSLVITTLFYSSRTKQKLTESIDRNAIDLLAATKNLVESQHNSILYIKTVMLSRRKIELKNNVTVLFSMINREYDLFKSGQISEYEAKQRAIKAIKQARYDNNVGYSWINDISNIPIMLMHPTLPELAGHPMEDTIYNYASGEEKNIGKAFINVCREKGEGYVDYLWPKPTSDGLTEKQPKISFVKIFKPWNWIIGNGVYYDDIEKDVENRINAVIDDMNNIIVKQKIGESGYFFIFNEDSFVLVHPNIAGDSAYNLINPSTGNFLFNELKESAHGSKHFMEYEWDKPGFEGEYRFPKKTFVTYYEPLGWYIASSVYKEDFEKEINNLTNTILLFSSSFFIVALIVSLLLSRSITSPLRILVNSISNHDKDGLPIKVISATKISEIKLLGTTINSMIDSIRKSGKELKVERDFSMELINTAPYIICGLDSEGITTFINSAGEKITAYSKEEIIGTNWWKLLFPNVKNMAGEKMFNHLPEGEAVELILVNKNGEKKDIVWNSFAKRDNNNNILEIIGFAYDITKRKQMELELVASKEKAEESDRLKSAFLANMSHEIRTPMNGILGFAQLLKQPELTGKTQQKYIRIIEKSGDRMLNIINDIVSISKIESGQMEVNIQKTNINEQVEYVYDLFKIEVERKGLQFSFKNSLSSDEAFLNTDSEKIYVILTNLVKNAIKYTESGSIEFGYLLKKDRQTVDVEFYVKDTGIGIPNNRQQAIFERFIQADIADKMAHQGAGLGLSISKALVEMLGGKIWVESTEGVGSKFYFTVPYNLNNKELMESNIEGEKEHKAVAKKLKILIVDDEEFVITYLKIVLKSFIKEVLIANTGIEAVDLCRNNPDIDLVLMDIRIPDIDGYEATRRIREFNKDVFILAQTAFAQSGDMEMCLEAGCDDYITKPIRKDKLFEIIKTNF